LFVAKHKLLWYQAQNTWTCLLDESLLSVEKEEDLTILINLDLVNDADGNDVMDNDDNVDQVHYVPKQLSASQFYKNA